MRSPEQIVSDGDVERIHANANFGPCLTKRQVVNQGVLTYALGYTSGHTQMCILRAHGLITKPNGYHARLTKKGTEYLRSLFDGVSLSTILNLAEKK